LIPPRSLYAASAALLAALLAVLVAVAPAHAASGPPPPTLDPRVIAGIHTDAVAPFVDTVGGEQRLVLASRADVDGQHGKRFTASDVLFHLEDNAKATVPPGFEFLGPVGSDTWIAPMTQEPGVLWPGFSTEGIPAGVLDGNAVELRLQSVDGPGTFHLFTVGAFGNATQLLTVGGPAWKLSTNQHVHANWAFSAAGRYELTFRADAKIGGTPVSGTTTYAFHVSALPTAAPTTTTVEADPARPALGDDVALTAAVAPARAEGYVEFLDGETSLGHAEVSDGTARLVTDALPLGERAITARFTPKTSRTHAPSTSAPRTVTVVAEPGGDAFEIAGVRSSYVAGETLTARVRGWTLKEGQSYWWTVRKDANDTEYVMSDVEGGTAAQGTLVRELTSAYDGYEISALLRGPGPNGRDVTLQSTPFVKLAVTGEDRGSGRPIKVTGQPTEPVYSGDRVEVETGTQLGAGERFAWVTRFARVHAAWEEQQEGEVRGSGPWGIATVGSGDREWALQIRGADGKVLGQSAPLLLSVQAREVQLEGLRSIYRVGDTLRANVSVWPALPGATFAWNLEWEPIAGAAGTSIEMPVTADMHGKTLSVDVNADNGFTGWYAWAGSASHRIAVTDAAPGEQVLMFDALAGHYHQGGTIALRVNADPVASDTDTVRWEWKRRGDAEFLPVPGATGFAHDVRAEQALDGTQVRATLLTADGKELATTEELATIHVDDHGAKPQQQVSIDGTPGGHVAGDRVELRAKVEPGTALDRYRWLVQKPGAAKPEVVAGQHGATYAFTATEALDGAKISVAVAYGDGAVAYGPSAPVTLDIAAAPPGDEEPSPAPGDGQQTPPVDDGQGQTPPAPTPPSPGPATPPAATAPVPPAQGADRSRAVVAEPRVARLASRRALRGRSAVLARVACPAGGTACRAQAPRQVSVRIAGKRFVARVELAKTIRAGRRASVRIVLTRDAVRRLAKRRTTVSVPVTVTTGGQRTRTTVRVVLVG